MNHQQLRLNDSSSILESQLFWTDANTNSSNSQERGERHLNKIRALFLLDINRGVQRHISA